MITRAARLLLAMGAVLGALSAPTAVASAAQQQHAFLPAGDDQSAARAPWGIGERLAYQVRLGGVGVGRGSLEVLGTENVDGRSTYRTRFVVQGGIPLARVNNRLESWIDVRGLFSRRFYQNQHEVNFRRNRTYNFFPEQREFLRLGETAREALPTARPQDDVSIIYYARTLPLRVGDTYVLRDYFKADGNPVELRVLRRETVSVPAGRFQTVVIRPIIKTDGLFGQGGQAEIFLTDDNRRLPIQIRSRVPVIGSLSLHLQSVRTGQPLAAPFMAPQ